MPHNKTKQTTVNKIFFLTLFLVSPSNVRLQGPARSDGPLEVPVGQRRPCQMSSFVIDTLTSLDALGASYKLDIAFTEFPLVLYFLFFDWIVFIKLSIIEIFLALHHNA